jgi:hypothetical protein
MPIVSPHLKSRCLQPPPVTPPRHTAASLGELSGRSPRHPSTRPLDRPQRNMLSPKRKQPIRNIAHKVAQRASLVVKAGFGQW